MVQAKGLARQDTIVRRGTLYDVITTVNRRPRKSYQLMLIEHKIDQKVKEGKIELTEACEPDQILRPIMLVHDIYRFFYISVYYYLGAFTPFLINFCLVLFHF